MLQRNASIALVLLLLVFAAVGWWYPKTHRWDNGTLECSATYRGYFWHQDVSYLTVTTRDSETGTWQLAKNARGGFSEVEGFYADGSLCEQGVCWIDVETFPPWIDSQKVRWGKYYRPDGSLGAEIINGNGSQGYWRPDGQLLWEATFKNGLCTSLKRWHSNGQLQTHGQLVNQRFDGLWGSYHPNGQLKAKGRYKNGQAIGPWEHYHEDGRPDDRAR